MFGHIAAFVTAVNTHRFSFPIILDFTVNEYIKYVFQTASNALAAEFAVLLVIGKNKDDGFAVFAVGVVQGVVAAVGLKADAALPGKNLLQIFALGQIGGVNMVDFAHGFHTILLFGEETVGGGLASGLPSAMLFATVSEAIRETLRKAVFSFSISLSVSAVCRM